MKSWQLFCAMTALLITLSESAFAAKCKGSEAAKNQRIAEAFLASNSKKPGVITTASGLQYQVLREGNGGDTPSRRSEIVAHYDLTNLDGKKLDSSRDRGVPYQTRADQVIEGWSEALQAMTVGERRLVYVPAELGYGCKGIRGIIGPNELLVFDMELVHIVKPGD
ncbi:FKBP-type peptidyl-prolyl cis-trans isomerase [Aurantivibrio plasticivorans]